MFNNKSPVNPKIIKSSRIVIDFVLSNKKKLLEIAENNDLQIISGNSILIHQIPSMLKFLILKRCLNYKWIKLRMIIFN